VDHSNEFQYKVDRQILFYNSNLKWYFIQCGPWKGNKLQSGPLQWISNTKWTAKYYFLIPTWNDILFNVDPEKEINYKVDHSNEFQYKVDRLILFLNSNLKWYFIQCGPWKGNKLQSGPLQLISVQSGPPNIFLNSNLKWYFIQCGPWKGNKLQSGPLQWISVQSGPPNIIF